MTSTPHPPTTLAGWRHPVPRLVIAMLVLAALGATVTGMLAPSQVPALLYEFALTLVGTSLGLWASRRATVDDVGRLFFVVAAVLTVLLWTPLGVVRMAARRHVELGPMVVQPSVFWVVACHATAVSVALGRMHMWPWLAASLLGAATAALAMPELSIVPQVVAGLLVVAWLTGRRRLAVVALGAIVLAIAASALIPYVRRRWIGFLDPDGHARGAGYDYRALGRLVRQSLWLGSPDGVMPRTSSPSDDYWLAAGMWRLGKLPVLAWIAAFVVTLRGVQRYSSRPQETGHSLLAQAIVASVLTALAIHAGYNLGLWPITAISAPFSGIIGGVTAVTLFGLCFGIGSPLDAATIEGEHGAHTTGDKGDLNHGSS